MPSRKNHPLPLLALLLAACQSPVTGSPGTPGASATPAPPHSLTVTLQPAGFDIAALLPASWDHVTAHLSGPNGLSLDASADATSDPTGPHAQLVFTGTTPGGASLSLTFQRKDASGTEQTVATLTHPNVTLSTGADTLTLTDAPTLVPLTAASPTGAAGSVTTVPNVPGVAELDMPYGLTAGPDGAFYLAEVGSNTIRRLAPDPHGWLAMTTLAGTGATGTSDGNGTRASFTYPTQSAFGPDGALYVADTKDQLIRRVTLSATGQATVTTLKVVSAPGEPDAGAAVQFNLPLGLAIDASGAIYVGEQTAIRKLTPAADGSYLAVRWSGDPSITGSRDGDGTYAAYGSIHALQFGPDGALYVADEGNGQVRKVTSSSTGVATCQTLTIGNFFSPGALAFDATGALYVAEISRISRIDPAFKSATVITGQAQTGFVDGDLGRAQFDGIAGLTVMPDGALLVTDSLNHRLRRVDLTAGRVTTLVGDGTPSSRDGAAAQPVVWSHVTGLASLPSGVTLLADPVANRIVSLGPDGSVATFAGGASGQADGPLAQARFAGPTGLVVSPAGTIYVTDAPNGAVRAIARDASGQWRVSTVIGGLVNPYGIALDPSGNLIVSEAGSADPAQRSTHDVVRVTLGATPGLTRLAGGVMGDVDGPGAKAAFDHPLGLAVDPAGTIAVADSGNNRIRRITVDASGQATVSTLAGSGAAASTDGMRTSAAFDAPSGLTFGPDGTLYVADQSSHRIRAIAKDGTVSTLSGSDQGLADGSAAQAKFSRPLAITLGADGMLEVADSYTGGLRRVAP